MTGRQDSQVAWIRSVLEARRQGGAILTDKALAALVRFCVDSLQLEFSVQTEEVAAAISIDATIATSPLLLAQRVSQVIVERDDRAASALAQYGNGEHLLRWVASAEPSATRDQVEIAGKVGRIARTIARMATHAVQHETSIRSAQDSRVVAGTQWNLSARHPIPDVCDLFAKLDLYGLGRGVYPTSMVPVVPHPDCLCFATDVLLPPADWGSPPRSFVPPRLVTLAEAGEISGGNSEAVRLLNLHNDLLTERTP